MATTEQYRIDLSLSPEARKGLSFDELRDHGVAVILGSWAAGSAFRIATPSEMTKHQTQHPEGFAAVQSQAERELASRGIVRPPELSLAPPVEEGYQQPQPERHASEAA